MVASSVAECIESVTGVLSWQAVRPASSPQAHPSRNDPRPPPRALNGLGSAAAQGAVVASDAHGGRGEADSDGEERVEPPDGLAVIPSRSSAEEAGELTWISGMPVGGPCWTSGSAMSVG